MEQSLRAAYKEAYAHVQGRLMALPEDRRFTINESGRVLSHSTLRSEIKLDSTKSNYVFGINQNDVYNGQVIYNTEIRLQPQDSFYVSAVGYFLRVVKTAGNNTDYRSQLFTHPAGQFYSGSNTNTWEQLWSGKLSFTVNNIVYNPSWNLQNHYNVPQTQYPVFGIADPYQQYPVNDQRDGSTDGYYPMQPMMLLDGSYNNQVQLTFDDSIADILGGGELHMVLMLRGILAQNISKLMEPGFITP
jgi:hypothetical protein